MTTGAVGKTALPVFLAFGFESDDELGSTDIDSTAEENFRRQLVHEWLLELICDSGFRPGQTLGADLEHAGSQGLRFSTASEEKGRRPLFAQAQLRPKGGTASPPKRDPYRSHVQKWKIQGWDLICGKILSSPSESPIPAKPNKSRQK